MCANKCFFLAASQEKLGFIFTKTTNMENMAVKKFVAILIEHCKKKSHSTTGSNR